MSCNIFDTQEFNDSYCPKSFIGPHADGVIPEDVSSFVRTADGKVLPDLNEVIIWTRFGLCVFNNISVTQTYFVVLGVR